MQGSLENAINLWNQTNGTGVIRLGLLHIVQTLDNITFACLKPCWEKHFQDWKFQHSDALQSGLFTV